MAKTIEVRHEGGQRVAGGAVSRAEQVASTVANRKAQAELARIQWRAAMMAAGRTAELVELARRVGYAEKLTYEPGVKP